MAKSNKKTAKKVTKPVEKMVESKENTEKYIKAEEIKEVVKEEVNPKQDLIDFVESMRGKQRATQAEVKVMFALYEKYTGRRERNYTCDSCVIRVFSALKQLI